MTRDKWKRMSEQYRTLWIADLCGWKDIVNNDPALCDPEDIGAQLVGKTPLCIERGADYLCPVPDYLHDLNAMHELEVRYIFGKVASEKMQRKMWEGYTLVEQYISLLETVCNSRSGITFATAGQRAEAFALTMSE